MTIEIIYRIDAMIATGSRSSLAPLIKELMKSLSRRTIDNMKQIDSNSIHAESEPRHLQDFDASNLVAGVGC